MLSLVYFFSGICSVLLGLGGFFGGLYLMIGFIKEITEDVFIGIVLILSCLTMCAVGIFSCVCSIVFFGFIG